MDNPKPTYPRVLYRAGITGEVRVTLYVRADGSVSQPVVLKATHPEFAAASLAAVSKWRFRPWKVSDDRPGQIEVVAPMVFKLDDTPPLHANEQLKKLLCSDVSRVAQHYAESSWVDLPVFSWTRSYLTHSISPMQLPEEKRLALIAKLNKEARTIVRRCHSHPMSRYVRFVPREVRELL
ncbi:energy transducer TonB [Pseudomonas sp. 14P_8.1_Bac3]|uniref:energy transducer TonB n=1 Tax=Pseudomonas sp. 14P_8.1_Bac3 TaxID=2971621 RepID=UPI0021C6EF59|nr:energy transducer TonB [Pseudomonas sp. 14P_8.1_Bac3]MCU1762552.1 energy transducer TonB [Pseudomonas sp. 14P_8.1_Bac3]